MAAGTKTIYLPVPSGGERDDVPDQDLPISAFKILQNAIRSNKGTLVRRPGFKQIVAPGPGGRTMGIAFYSTTAGANRLVVGNLTGWKQFNGTSWIDITGAALTGSSLNPVRFTVFPQGSPIAYNLIGVNGVDSPKTWDGVAATYSNLAGAPPIAIDVAAAFNRVLMLVNPNQVRISGFNDATVWDSLLVATLADAGDLMIGMQRIRRTAVAIYGERSQWLGYGQAGNFPFRFEMIDEQPGPVSSAAIVRDGAVHYYLSEDGNIYRFDGTASIAVGGAMQPFVLDNLNLTNRAMSHGLFLQGFNIAAFFFPSTGSTVPNFGVYINTRTGEMGRLKVGGLTASTKGKQMSSVTWDSLTGTWDNLSLTYPTWDSMGAAGNRVEIVADANGQVHYFNVGDGSDNGAPIEMIWEYGLLSPGGIDKNFRPLAWETFFKKTASPVTIETSVGITDTLMSDRSLVAAPNIDISIDQRNDIDLSSLDLENRFTTIRHRTNTLIGNIVHLGGLLHGSEAAIAAGPTDK